MNKKTLIAMIVMVWLIPFSSFSQSISSINAESEIAENSNSYTDGFAKHTGGDKMQYFNQWNDKIDAIMTRANNGEMIIEWSADREVNVVDGVVNYIAIVSMDQALERVNFNLSIDGVEVGSFYNFKEASWSKKFESGVILSFARYAQNETKDAGMFMTITVPEALVKRGEATSFKIVGEAAESNAWFMVFTNENLIEEIIHRYKTDEYFRIDLDGSSVTVSAPLKWTNKSVELNIGSKSETKKFIKNGGISKITISGVDIDSKLPVVVKYAGSEVVNIDNLLTQEREVILDGYTLTKIECAERSGVKTVEVKSKYSDAQDKVATLGEGTLGEATIYTVVSSHQDIAWMDTPYACVEKRDKVIVTPAIDLLKEDSRFYYDLEDVLMLREYLERHPDRSGEIAELIKGERLGIGASYTQPYEEMQSGEALARQFYFGKRWIDSKYGTDVQTYWNVDVPGRTPQMPQILRKAGVRNIMYSRHEKGLYNWYSPDNSSVTVYTPGHYTASAQFLHKEPQEAISTFEEFVSTWDDYRVDKSSAPIVGMLSSEDMSTPKAYYNWIETFDSWEKEHNIALPNIKHTISDKFFTAVRRDEKNFTEIRGERPDAWLYIHGPGHEEALTTYKEAEAKSVAGEKFSTIASLLNDDFSRYPQEELDDAWISIIFPDHGWGGNGGAVTDSLFKAKYIHANNVSGKVVDRALDQISSHIKLNRKRGLPVVVYNDLSWRRSEVVNINLNRSEYSEGNISVESAEGESIPFQLNRDNSDSSTLAIEFIADVPSVGYSTYYVETTKRSVTHEAKESGFYSIDFKDGKINQITDLELNQELFDTSKFEIGEVISMQSIGNGAGEFATVQLPSMKGYESTSLKGAKWSVEPGAVYTTYRSTTQFTDCSVVREVKVYNTIKKIDFETDILDFNGRDYREFRQMFATIGKGDVSYDVPFGKVTVGEDEMEGAPGERYQVEAKDIHPRAVTNWIGVSNENVGVTISSSVVAADYIDPTDNPVDSDVLQPILFASRRSCHWLGEFYSQKGDHSFKFSLNSHAPTWRDGAAHGFAANHPLYVVQNPKSYTTASLEESKSFFSVEEQGVWISTIKKSEDDNSVVVRLYDMYGAEKSVTIESAFDFKKIYSSTLIETDREELSGDVLNIGEFAIETFILTK